MNINIVCVGKIKENFYKDAVSEYAKRLTRFCKFNVVEVAESRLESNDINKVKVIEIGRASCRERVWLKV